VKFELSGVKEPFLIPLRYIVVNARLRCAHGPSNYLPIH
jgi:hypothetical protein